MIKVMNDRKLKIKGNNSIYDTITNNSKERIERIGIVRGSEELWQHNCGHRITGREAD